MPTRRFVTAYTVVEFRHVKSPFHDSYGPKESSAQATTAARTSALGHVSLLAVGFGQSCAIIAPVALCGSRLLSVLMLLAGVFRHIRGLHLVRGPGCGPLASSMSTKTTAPWPSSVFSPLPGSSWGRRNLPIPALVHRHTFYYHAGPEGKERSSEGPPGTGDRNRSGIWSCGLIFVCIPSTL